MIKAAWPVPQPNLLVLHSREAILDLVPLLESLAVRCGSAASMESLLEVLAGASQKRQIPYLVLVLRPEEHQGSSLSADDVEAAALLLEQRVGGLRMGTIVTAEARGFTGVIAAAGQEMRTAALAIRALIERGAEVVLATFGGAANLDLETAFGDGLRVVSAVHRRTHDDATGISDLVVRRKGLRAVGLCSFIRSVAGLGETPGCLNTLARALREPGLKWTAGVRPAPPARPVLGKAAASGANSVIKDALLN